MSDLTNSRFYREPNAAENERTEQAFIVWLVETLHYPFDLSFSTPPPVDHGKLADYWNGSDNWQVTAEDARIVVFEEAGICPCGCLPDMHIGEIGCPCGLPDELPCSPTTHPTDRGASA